MNSNANPTQFKVAATYNAAADFFDAPPLAFWNRHGRRAVELVGLRPGDRVLDVGCGTGASAIPAAEVVGPTGRIIGLDVAESMLQRARDKAAARGLKNVEFRLGDMMASGEPDESFDVVISIFSIFFVEDMVRLVGELWCMLRPGDRTVVTVWDQRSFEPAVQIFFEELRRVRPDLPAAPRPWERLIVPEGLSRMITGGGASEPEIHHAPDLQALSDPSDWWTIVIGSGFRGEISQLEPDEQRVLKARVLRRLSEEGIGEMETNALHAIARKSG